MGTGNVKVWMMGLALAGVISSPAWGQATEGGPPAMNIAPPTDTQREPELKLSFPIGEGVGRGDVICVPVTLGGKERMFVVDTGCSDTVVDSALVRHLGPEITGREITAASGESVTGKRYQFRFFSVGGKSLPTAGYVCAMDCGLFRKALGRPIEGIIGVDVLSSYVVRFDFGRRVLEIGDVALEQDVGVTFPLRWHGRGPAIATDWGGLPERVVDLDSGAVNSSSSEDLIGKFGKEVVTEYATPYFDASGEHDSSYYLVRRQWTFAGVAFQNKMLNRNDWNLMGLDVLTDFVVTFDFPKERIYFKKLKDAHKGVVPTNSLHLMLDNERFFLHHLDEFGKSQGLQDGDELLQIEGADVKGKELWRVREQGRQGKAMALKIRRGDQALDMTFHGEIPPVPKNPKATASVSATGATHP
jgi:hypothetical protein